MAHGGAIVGRVPALSELRDLAESQRVALEQVERSAPLVTTFYLTVGTLLKGRGIVPRESNDLDFFTFPTVESLRYTQRLRDLQAVLAEAFGAQAVVPTDRGFLHTESRMVIDVVQDAVPAIDDFVAYGQLQTAGLKDCAASKASALCSRDEVKDYIDIDIAFLTHSMGWSLKDLATFAEQKFGLGTVREEKLFTELLAKRDLFAIPPGAFIRDHAQNVVLLEKQVQHLLDQTTL